MKAINRMRSFRARWRLCALAGLAVLVGVVLPSTIAQAQASRQEPAGTQIQSTTTLAAAAAQVRTRTDMEQAMATRAPVAGAVVVPFRPTMSEFEYGLAKNAAAGDAMSGPKRLNVPEQPLAPPIVTGANFDGVDRTVAGGGFPPDTHGAVGLDQYVQVTNSHLDVYDLSGTPLLSVDFASFFGYTARTIFDPRVVYDSTWNRWVISAEAFPETPTVQLQFLAISRSSDATGPFFIYAFNVLFNANFFWDFPQLGIDQDAVIVTANYFNGPTFVDARALAVAKARLYNGLGFAVPVFTGLCGTLAPPIVLDQNASTFLICARPVGTTITKYTMRDSSRPNATTLVASSITVPAYTVPPNARQPGTTARLDTSDSRFVNASTQNGNSLWQVHTVNLVGFPGPKYYEFNTVTNTIIRSAFFFASNTSDDWNASIAANPAGDVFVTWSDTDTPADTNAQVRFSGRCHGDPPDIGAGVAVVTSPTFSSQFDGSLFRWGDYSAVALQPSDANMAWVVNEWTVDTPIWGSHITQIGFSPACP